MLSSTANVDVSSTQLPDVSDISLNLTQKHSHDYSKHSTSHICSPFSYKTQQETIFSNSDRWFSSFFSAHDLPHDLRLHFMLYLIMNVKGNGPEFIWALEIKK